MIWFISGLAVALAIACGILVYLLIIILNTSEEVVKQSDRRVLRANADRDAFTVRWESELADRQLFEKRCEAAQDRQRKAEQRALESHEAYQALEQGMTEQEENYEMQFLTFKETLLAQEWVIGELSTDILSLLDIVEDHRDNCLSVNAIKAHHAHTSENG